MVLPPPFRELGYSRLMAYGLHGRRHPEAGVGNCKRAANVRMRPTNSGAALNQRELRRPYGANRSGYLSWESPEVIRDCSRGKRSASAAAAMVSCPGGLKP